jgi:transposase-like protein
MTMPKKIEKTTLTLTAIARSFSDEAAAWNFLEYVRWPNGPICPHCGVVNNAKFMEPRKGERKTKTGKVTFRRVWQCNDCKKQFSALVGTIFEDSRIPLNKWLLAMHEMWADKNGVSSLELSRKLDITQKSAWFMAHRIRFAVQNQSFDKMTGIVEADETYFGGKASNMHKSKRKEKIQGRGTVGKTPVFSIVERGGKVRSQVMHNVDSETVTDALKANVDQSATLMTDTSTVYPKAGKEFADHQTVDHSADEYVRGDAYTNTAEGFFGQLKPSIRGTYKQVSVKHLNRYLAEFDHRYSTRREADGERTIGGIKQAAGKRLTYKELIAKDVE